MGWNPASNSEAGGHGLEGDGTSQGVRRWALNHPTNMTMMCDDCDEVTPIFLLTRAHPPIINSQTDGKSNGRPDSDPDTVLFLPDLGWDELADIGGVHMDLESVLEREIDLTARPPDDFVEKVKTHWMPIRPQMTPSARTDEEETSGTKWAPNESLRDVV